MSAITFRYASTFSIHSHQAGLTAYPVSTAVGNVANNGPELVEPLPLTGDQPDGDDAQGTLL